MGTKFGKTFENVSKLFDHAAHNDSNYLNGHCFESVMPCVPLWNKNRIHYLAVLLGYRMCQKRVSKLELAASMVRQGMSAFSTVFPEQIEIFCMWQKNPLNQTKSDRMQYIPIFLYVFRWNIEVSYYEQKTFWSLCNYMVRSRNSIEMLVNLINITYCAIKILPYQDKLFSKYCTEIPVCS